MDRKWKVLLAVGTGVILTKLVLADSKPLLPTVSSVDLTRYVGNVVRDSAISKLV